MLIEVGVFWKKNHFFQLVHSCNDKIAESSQPLHLFLSSANAKSLESARILAENLLDTIAAECGATRYVLILPGNYKWDYGSVNHCISFLCLY